MQAQVACWVDGGLDDELGERQGAELDEREADRDGDVARNAAAVGGDGVDHEATVLALGRGDHEAGECGVDGEAACALHALLFPEFERGLALDEFGHEARVGDREAAVCEEGFAHAGGVGREAERLEAGAGDVVDDLAVLVAVKHGAVVGAHVGFAPEVRVGAQHLDGFLRLFVDGIDAAAAVSVDVGEVQALALGGLDDLAHAEDVGARSVRTGVPGDVGVHVVGGLDEFAARFKRQRPVAAHDLDADGALFEAFTDKLLELLARGRHRAAVLHGREAFEHRDVDACAAGLGRLEDFVDGTRHVEAGRHAGGSRHARAVSRAEHAAEMQMGIDEAGHDDEAREVLDFGSFALEVRSDGCNAAVLDGHVHDAVSAVDRVHDTGILEKTIPHNLILLLVGAALGRLVCWSDGGGRLRAGHSS